MSPKPKPAIRLGLFGSMIFGAVLAFAGYAFKHYLYDSGMYGGDDGTKIAIAGWVMMLIGAFIVVANLAWLGFILYLYFTEK